MLRALVGKMDIRQVQLGNVSREKEILENSQEEMLKL